MTPTCEPVVRANLEFWQTNAEGQYDYAGYKLRGGQHTDEHGRYRLETIVPGFYAHHPNIHYFVGGHLHGPLKSLIKTNVINFPSEDGFKSASRLTARP